jgi:hypothetical protein
VFTVSIPLVVIAFLLAWLIPEYPLRNSSAVGVTEDSLRAESEAAAAIIH